MPSQVDEPVRPRGQLRLGLDRLTTRLEVDLHDGGIAVGTAFFAQYQWRDRRGTFIVTNKHVVRDSVRGRFSIPGVDGEDSLMPNRRDFEIESFEEWWFGHLDPDIDIAVAPMPPPGLEDEGARILVARVDEREVPTNEEVRELERIEDVVFCGYPEGLYDATNLDPVVRQGITATALYKDFEGCPCFLVDAAVFPGNSGGPVYIRETALGVQRGAHAGNMGIVSGLKWFVGVICETYIRTSAGEIRRVQIPTTVRADPTEGQPLSLAVALKAHLVFEAIRAWGRERGLEELGGSNCSA